MTWATFSESSSCFAREDWLLPRISSGSSGNGNLPVLLLQEPALQHRRPVLHRKGPRLSPQSLQPLKPSQTSPLSALTFSHPDSEKPTGISWVFLIRPESKCLPQPHLLVSSLFEVRLCLHFPKVSSCRSLGTSLASVTAPTWKVSLIQSPGLFCSLVKLQLA